MNHQKNHPIKKKGENIFKFCSSWPRTLDLGSYVWKFDEISLKWFHINLVLGLIKVYLWIIVNNLLSNRNRETHSLLLTTLSTMFGNSNAGYHQIFSKLFHIGLVFGYQYLFMNIGKYFKKSLKEIEKKIQFIIDHPVSMFGNSNARYRLICSRHQWEGVICQTGATEPPLDTLTLFIDTRSYIKNKTDFVILFFKCINTLNLHMNLVCSRKKGKCSLCTSIYFQSFLSFRNSILWGETRYVVIQTKKC